MTATTTTTIRAKAAEATVRSGHELTIRRLDTRVNAATPRYWLAGNPLLTHVLNVLSATFPPGERYFVDSVRRLSAKVTDPTLRRQVRGFLGQEALHAKQHEAFNAWIKAQGGGLDRFTAYVDRVLKLQESLSTPLMNLARTVALEHFTAVMAHAYLTTPGFVDETHEDARPLWIWHSIEEIEHKAVAFDVYKAAGGSYLMMITAMTLMTIRLVGSVAALVVLMLLRDGQWRNGRQLLTGLRRIFGRRGILTRSLVPIATFYKPSFHPWDTDDSAMIAVWSARLYADQKATGGRA